MPACVYNFRAPEWQEYTSCCACGVDFSSPVLSERRNDGRKFYCPNGHGQSWSETEATKLRKELEAARAALVRANSSIEWERGEKLTVQKKLKRIEKRVSKGVCPCCQRIFGNVQRHMATKHPDFTKAE